MNLLSQLLTPIWPLAVLWPVLALVAALARSRQFGVAMAIFFGVSLAIWLGLDRGLASSAPESVRWALRVGAYLVLLHYGMLIRPRLRPLWYRLAVSLPALWFLAGTLLAFPWAIAGGLGLELEPWTLWWLPFALATIGFVGSLANRRETVPLHLDDIDVGPLKRHRVSSNPSDREALTIFQIADPHLGPFMSPARLHRICQRAVEHDPDLVVVTGDLLTMESQAHPDAVAHALAPLEQLSGRVFACFGNHDHEARSTVEHALTRVGARLLVDEHATVDTRIGPIEIIGSDFHWRDRGAKLAALVDAVGPRNGTPRLLLLHDPGAFRHLPPATVDLALSGHTHGGQLGLVRFGFNWTIMSALSNVPDHGLWAQDKNRLYVHRGTGHYGFPIRLGVPGEESLLQVQFPAL